MSTSFNFPANPTLNQIVVLPDGNSAQWNGYAWVSVTDNPTYPLAIPKGGTGATNPDTALTNLGGGAFGVPMFKTATAAAARQILGINTATGEFIIPTDGTVAKPGLAFASEPGLGWYRESTGKINMASAGGTGFGFDQSSPSNSTFRIGPRAAAGGYTSINLYGGPSGAANMALLGIGIDGAAGAVYMSSAQVGTGPALPFKFYAPDFTFSGPATFTTTVNVAGNFNALGQMTANTFELGATSGGTGTFLDFHDGTPTDFAIRLSLEPGSPQWLKLYSPYANGGIRFEGTQGGVVFANITASNGANTIAFGWRSDSKIGLRVDASQFGSTWPIDITGGAGYATNADTVDGYHVTQLVTNDSITTAGFASNNQWYPYFRKTDTGGIIGLMINVNGTAGGAAIDGTFMNVWNNSGTHVWFGSGTAVCDENVKRLIEPSTRDALADIRAMEFIAFNYIESEAYTETADGEVVRTGPDPDIRHEIGFRAQNLQSILAHYVSADAVGKLYPNPNELLPLALCAIQKLNERLTQLEQA